MREICNRKYRLSNQNGEEVNINNNVHSEYQNGFYNSFSTKSTLRRNHQYVHNPWFDNSELNFARIQLQGKLLNKESQMKYYKTLGKYM